MLGLDVTSTVRLVGGMSSEMFRFTLVDGSDVVTRHITDRAWLAREPNLIRNERRALEFLAAGAIPAPHHLASDPEEGRLMMTYLPGAIQSSASALTARVEELARQTAAIAAVSLPPDHGFPPWRSWAPGQLTIPTWGDEHLWGDAIAFFGERTAPEAETPALLHRDFHPLNVLWRDSTVSGVVDWVNACVGHPHAELGHCRWNLAVLAGQDSADAFLKHYLRITGDPFADPWWDVATLIGLLPGPIGCSGWHQIGRMDLTTERVVAGTEAFLIAALRRT